ncbi:MAG: RsmB/NOP family class I SAM-dependent RNA methyltransferase [Bdellovibrionota bacterium]
MSHDQFQEFYLELFKERWPILNQALLKGETQMARRNGWLTEQQSQQQDFHQLSSEKWNSLLEGFFLDEKKIVPHRVESDLLDFYVMDPASIFAAKALQVEDGHRVLDMCAAPGGKSLILIEMLKTSGEIICNDVSTDRRERLKKVIQNYVPRQIRSRVWIKGQDGVQYGLREPESFNRILLDVPCSGERHVLSDPKAIKDWSPKRPKGLEQRQYALLSAAFLALKPESLMVYSTCSLNPKENDGVVGRLLEKRGDFVEVDEINSDSLSGAEKTKFGLIYLPDRCGFGPLYVSRLFKRNSFRS